MYPMRHKGIDTEYRKKKKIQKRNPCRFLFLYFVCITFSLGLGSNDQQRVTAETVDRRWLMNIFDLWCSNERNHDFSAHVEKNLLSVLKILNEEVRSDDVKDISVTSSYIIADTKGWRTEAMAVSTSDTTFASINLWLNIISADQPCGEHMSCREWSLCEMLTPQAVSDASEASYCAQTGIES